MKEEIREFIFQLLSGENNRNRIEINDDTDLSILGLTSINLIKVIIFVEDKYDVELDDEYLLVEKLNTVNKIVDCILSSHTN